MVELSQAQDKEVGDGTTSVVIIAGALLYSCKALFEKGIHPSRIADSFLSAGQKAQEILQTIAIPCGVHQKHILIQAAQISLRSKVNI
jgi:T-complex protein 1 subunit delta